MVPLLMDQNSMVLQSLCSLVTESTLEFLRASLGKCFDYKISSKKLSFLEEYFSASDDFASDTAMMEF